MAPEVPPHTPAAFWEARYGATTYAYGTAPNAFLAEQLARLPAGTLLLPAEGEGRNAVWAARSGWDVTATDFSAEARRKALALAATHGVSIQYTVAPVEEYSFPEAAFDAVALIFAHQPPQVRRLLHAGAVRALRPGGTLVYEAFGPQQLLHTSGGPRHVEWLPDLAAVQADFAALDVQLSQEGQPVLDEGPFHQGLAAVVRLVGRKPFP